MSIACMCTPVSLSCHTDERAHSVVYAFFSFAMRQAREGSIQEGPLLGPYGFNYNHQVIQNFVPTFSISVKPNAAAVAAQEKDPIGQIEAEMNGVVRQKGGSSMAGSTAGPSSSSSDSASASESSQGRTLADYNMTPVIHIIYKTECRLVVALRRCRSPSGS